MRENFELALREEISKLAGGMPGAFAKGEPYGMPLRVRRTLGIKGKAKEGLPGMVGTVGSGASTGTVTNVPKGMGAHGASTPPAVSSGGAAKIGADMVQIPKMKTRLDGMAPVRPNMTINQKPSPANPEKISIGSAFPSREQAFDALGLGLKDQVLGMISKEASHQRLIETIAALDELALAKTAEEALPILGKLSQLKKQAWFSQALRAAGGLGSRMLRSKAMWGLGAAGATAYGVGKLMKGTVDMATAEKGRQNQVMQQTGQNQ